MLFRLETVSPCLTVDTVWELSENEIDQNSLQTMMAGFFELQNLDEILREEKEFQVAAP